MSVCILPLVRLNILHGRICNKIEKNYNITLYSVIEYKMNTLETFTKDLFKALPNNVLHTFVEDMMEAIEPEPIPIELIGFHDCMIEHKQEWENTLKIPIEIPTIEELWYIYKRDGCIDWCISNANGNVHMYISFHKSSCFVQHGSR